MQQSSNGTWDPVWESLFRSREWGKYPPESVIRFAARNFYRVPDRSSVRILDIGCGPGACTWYMAREGFSVSGIDASATAIEQARRRNAAEGLSADLRIGDFGSLPWEKGSFDACVDNVSICANPFSSMQQCISEAHRVLKRGGLMFSAIFSDRTTGYGTGIRLGQGGYRDIPEGPLAGMGLITFVGRAGIEELFEQFAEVSVALESRGVAQGTDFVELWLITAKK